MWPYRQEMKLCSAIGLFIALSAVALAAWLLLVRRRQAADGAGESASAAIHRRHKAETAFRLAAVRESRKAGPLWRRVKMVRVHLPHHVQRFFVDQLMKRGHSTPFRSDPFDRIMGGRLTLDYDRVWRDEALRKAVRPYVRAVRAICVRDLRAPTDVAVSKVVFWCWREGQELRAHADNEVHRSRTGRWERKRGVTADYSSVLFLGTEGVDFDGGLLHFLDADRCIRPEAGRLVVFRSSRENCHEMDRVLRGNRHILTVLLRDPDGKPPDERTLFFFGSEDGQGHDEVALAADDFLSEMDAPRAASDSASVYSPSSESVYLQRDAQ